LQNNNIISYLGVFFLILKTAVNYGKK